MFEARASNFIFRYAALSYEPRNRPVKFVSSYSDAHPELDSVAEEDEALFHRTSWRSNEVYENL